MIWIIQLPEAADSNIRHHGCPSQIQRPKIKYSIRLLTDRLPPECYEQFEYLDIENIANLYNIIFQLQKQQAILRPVGCLHGEDISDHHRVLPEIRSETQRTDHQIFSEVVV
jgi:hypothetical protein